LARSAGKASAQRIYSASAICRSALVCSGCTLSRVASQRRRRLVKAEVCSQESLLPCSTQLHSNERNRKQPLFFLGTRRRGDPADVGATADGQNEGHLCWRGSDNDRPGGQTRSARGGRDEGGAAEHALESELPDNEGLRNVRRRDVEHEMAHIRRCVRT